MRMMGLLDSSYWISYFIVEGVIIGFAVSLLSAIISGGALFNGASFGIVLGFLFLYSLAVVPFCFFVTCFFDTPQTAGQATLGILLGKFFHIYHTL
jgi:ATP-binding cassette subfamily A (ABC1) protein 5